ncbi:uncharacterized transcriptional regulatory protein C3C7.04 [Aspergillus udagawae]|uniref:Uncharacterized transcriptional regulatory protein C3C7.04 n=1 Tax=Aspergillus udagawae TaxID=91492 RepID=A0ABQ1BCY6_9EURO|nr:uncharacterized transcriptional regulatory protein C3C7.04 [Aspergillus udagawae]
MWGSLTPLLAICKCDAQVTQLQDGWNCHRESRIKKRSSNAQKIKCSGSQPCNTCSRRKQSCKFDDRGQKILVTRGYIEDLQRKIVLLECGENETFSPQSLEQDASVPNNGDEETASRAEAEWRENLGSATNLTNLLSAAPSTFMAASSGRIFYMGTSSNWSFGRKILSMAHEHLYQSPLPTGGLIFDSSTGLELPIMPSLDFSIYLINAVKFHAGQLYHLFDEATFMNNLYAFYNIPEQHMVTSSLWYIHYLVILAFGKAFVVQRVQGSNPAGCELFTKALQLLPDTTQLCRDAIAASEILCCIALYLQSLDFRCPAYSFIGQAVRIALAEGMHTDMPVEHLAVYGPDGRLNRRFLLKTKSALGSTIDLADEICKSFDLRLDEASVSGVSRVSAHLHLLYHQSSESPLELLTSSANVRKLLQVCVDSVRRMLNILTVLQGQTLLDSFLPFDLESTFISTVVLATARTIDSSLLDDLTPWLQTTYKILDEMITRGNLVADFRKFELDQLASLFAQLSPDLRRQSSESAKKTPQERMWSPLPSPLTIPDTNLHPFGVPEISNLDNGFTTAEIMAVAESIDTGDVDWIAHAVTEN